MRLFEWFITSVFRPPLSPYYCYLTAIFVTKSQFSCTYYFIIMLVSVDWLTPVYIVLAGESTLNVVAVHSTLHLPYDHRMYGQNLTVQVRKYTILITFISSIVYTRWNKWKLAFVDGSTSQLSYPAIVIYLILIAQDIVVTFVIVRNSCECLLIFLWIFVFLVHTHLWPFSYWSCIDLGKRG
jgi:hypothetical protein